MGPCPVSNKSMNKTLLILIVITLVGLFLRVYKIDQYPVHLGHDEITQLYDAISIAQTGRDIYGNFLPTIFVSVNDFKPPFYTYATVIAYWIFGNSEILIRIPGVLFGTLIIPAVYFFTQQLLKRKDIALLAAVLTAIAPFEIFYSRKSFENGAGLFLLMVGFTFLFKFLETKKLRWLNSGIILLIAAMYTYFSHAVIIPLLFISFLVLFRHQFPKMKKYLWTVLLAVIVVIPLLAIIILNTDSLNRTSAVFVSQDTLLGETLSKIHSPNPVLIFVLKKYIFLTYIAQRYLNQFDPFYLFGNGLNLTNQVFLAQGILIFAQLPFLLLGIFYLIKAKDLLANRLFIVSWILIGAIPSGITFESHSPHRILMVFVMFNILTAVGFAQFYQWLRLIKVHYLFKLAAYSAVAGLFILNLLTFVHLYTVNFSYQRSQDIMYPFKSVAQFAAIQRNNFDQIVFDPLFGEAAPVIGTGAHYYIGYYGNIAPSEFQTIYRFGDREREVLLGKYSIRKIDWLQDLDQPNTLFIGSQWSIPIKDVAAEKIIKVIYYYDGQPAFYAVSTKNAK